jgi:hypothetical protein
MKPIPAISKPLVLQNINPTIPKKPTEILSDKSKAKTEVKTVNRQEKSKKKVDEVKNAPKLVVVVQQNPLEGHKVAPIVPTSSVQATATALMETKIKAMSVNIV